MDNVLHFDEFLDPEDLEVHKLNRVLAEIDRLNHKVDLVRSTVKNWEFDYERE